MKIRTLAACAVAAVSVAAILTTVPSRVQAVSILNVDLVHESQEFFYPAGTEVACVRGCSPFNVGFTTPPSSNDRLWMITEKVFHDLTNNSTTFAYSIVNLGYQDPITSWHVSNGGFDNASLRTLDAGWAFSSGPGLWSIELSGGSALGIGDSVSLQIDLAGLVGVGFGPTQIDFDGNIVSNPNWVASAPTVIPEPASLILLGSGLAGAGLLRRRRRKQGPGNNHLSILLPLGALLLLSASPRTAGAACPADCNDDGVVAVNELITGVGQALGRVSIDTCPSFDSDRNSSVSVGEIVGGVNAALEGCVTTFLEFATAEELRGSIQSSLVVACDDGIVHNSLEDYFFTTDATEIENCSGEGCAGPNAVVGGPVPAGEDPVWQVSEIVRRDCSQGNTTFTYIVFNSLFAEGIASFHVASDGAVASDWTSPPGWTFNDDGTFWVWETDDPAATIPALGASKQFSATIANLDTVVSFAPTYLDFFVVDTPDREIVGSGIECESASNCTPFQNWLVSSPLDLSIGGTVSGQVTDAGGLPLSGVTVTIDGESDTTNAGGLYEITDVERHPRVVVTFSAEGFSTTFGIAEFRAGGPKEYHLDKVLVPASDAQVIDPATGGIVQHNGSKVTFPPNSIDAMGLVEVVLSTIDPSSPEIGAFPGDFAAQSASGAAATLETFALFDVSITQGGIPIDLADGQTVTLEFLLPADTPLVTGESVALWFFDDATGLWVEEGLGTVGPSTTTAGRLAVIGTVSHFSWWNCDRPISTFGCLQGQVTDAGGTPVQGATVRGSGVDYNGTSRATTDSNGNYCLNVRVDSTVDVTASLLSNGAIQSQTVRVNSPELNTTCATGGCTPVPTLQLSGLTCIAGEVLDQVGFPISERPVGSSGGGSDTSDLNGEYCLVAPADSDVVLTSPGIAPVLAATGTGGDCSAPATCTEVILQESADGTETCLSGRVVEIDFGFPELTLSGAGPVPSPGPETPVVGAEVTAFDNSAEQSFGPVVTGPNGEFCIPGVTAFTEVFLEVEGPGNSCSGSSFGEIPTGEPGPTCGAGDCVNAGDIPCFVELPS